MNHKDAYEILTRCGVQTSACQNGFAVYADGAQWYFINDSANGIHIRNPKNIDGTVVITSVDEFLLWADRRCVDFEYVIDPTVIEQARVCGFL